MTLRHSIPEQPPGRGPRRLMALLAILLHVLFIWSLLGVAFVVVSYLREV